MSARQPWCRLYSETITDRKLTNAGRLAHMPKVLVMGVWSSLLCMANDSLERGKLLMCEDLPLTREQIAADLEMDEDDLGRLLDAFERFRMVAWENDTLVLCHWSERQFESDSSAKRVAKHRAKKQAEERQAPEKQPPPSRQRKPGPRPRQTKWTPESEQAAEKETMERCEDAGEEQPGNVAGEEPCNVTATLQDQSVKRYGNAPDTDSDSDTDTDITRARVGAGAPAPRVRRRTWEPPPPAIEPITEDVLAQLHEAFGASLVESVLAQGEYVDRHDLVIAVTQACRANGGVTT